MKILDRYVLFAFLKNYLISFLVLIGLYIVLDLVFNFDELVEVQTHGAALGGGASFLAVVSIIFDYYFYQIFLIYAQLSGVIAVVAAAFTLVRFSRFNELSPILSAGVPLLRVASPIIIASLCLNVLLLADQEVVVPRLIPKLTRNHGEIGQAVQKSYDIKAMQDANRALLFASKYTPPVPGSSAEMREFDLIERDEKFVPTAHIWADRAVYESESQTWRLTGGQRVTGLQPSLRRSNVQPVSAYRSNVTPEEIALFRSGSYVELLSTSRIDQLLERPQSYGTTDLLRVKHARVTAWFMNVVAVLLGIGCILTREPGRLKIDGLKLVIVVGLSMVIVFLCNQLAGRPPGGGAWAYRWPALMAWVPIFIFGPIAILLLDRMHTKRS